jgi:hypothetical protein
MEEGLMRKVLIVCVPVVLAFSLCAVAQDLGKALGGLGGGKNIKGMIAMGALESIMKDLSPDQKKQAEAAKKDYQDSEAKGGNSDKNLATFEGALKKILTSDQFKQFDAAKILKGNQLLKGDQLLKGLGK